MKHKLTANDWRRVFCILVGTVGYVIGTNFFIVPVGLYNGGLLGLAQVIRTACTTFLGASFPFDISGIISFLLNIPLMIFTYKTVGREFILKTLLCIGSQSLLLSVVPVYPLIGDDPLTCCIIGGILCGASVGFMLQNGGSSGGVDIIGMYYSKKGQQTVGRINLSINVFVYCLAFFVTGDIRRIIYTLIFASVNMFTIDKIHSQNINSEVLIISKHDDAEIQNAIILEMRRGVSYWEGFGAFTGESSRILYTVVSKYELPQLKKIIFRIDPKAFVSVKNNISISGNFEKRL